MNRKLVGRLLAFLSFATHSLSTDVTEEIVDETSDRNLYEYSTQVSYSKTSYRIALISGLTVSFGLLVYGIMGFLMAVCFHGKTFSRGREQLQKERRRHLDEVNNTSGEKKLRKHRKHHDDDSYDDDEDDLDTVNDDIKIEYKINDRNNKHYKSKTIDNSSNSNRNRYSSGKHSEKIDQRGLKERDIEIGVLNKFTKTKNAESKTEDNQMSRHAGKLWKEKMQKSKNNIISSTNNTSNNGNINNNINNINTNNSNYNSYASSSPPQQLQFINGLGKNSMDYIYNNNFVAPTSPKNAYNNFSNMNNIPINMGNMNNTMGNIINTMGNMNNTNNVSNNMNNMFIPNITNNSNNITTMGNVISESSNVGTTPNKAPRSLRDAVNKMQAKTSSPGFSSVVRSASPNRKR